MANIFFSGFESGTLNEWDSYGSSDGLNAPGVANSGSRTGTYCWYPNNGVYGGWSWKLLPSTEAELYMQFCYYQGSFANNNIPFRFYGPTAQLGYIQINTDRIVRLYSGAGSLLATGTKILNASQWYVIEVYALINDSGTITVRVDGIQDLTYSGDTKPGADTGINKVWVGMSANSLYVRFDDVIINNPSGSVNNSWPSGGRIIALAPNGAGNAAQWTPSAGNNYACVDEFPPSSADYVKATAVDLIDTYALANLPAGVTVIKALKVSTYGYRVGSPACLNIKGVLRIGGTDYVAATDSLPVPSYSGKVADSPILEVSPATSVAFTDTEINGMEAGFKSTA